MRNNFVTTALTGMALSFAISAPVQAEISIQYPAWIADLVLPGVADFEAATGETVNAIELPLNGYVERVALDFSADTAGDVVVTDSFVVNELAEAGYLLPLGDRAEGWDQFQYYMDGLIDVVSSAGELYALPTDTDVRMLWYSKALFEKSGIITPWQPETWQDIVDAAQTIKDKTGIDNTWLLPAGLKYAEGATMQGFYMVMLGADTATDDRNRLRNNTLGKWIGDSPAIRRTLEFYREVYIEKELTTAALNYSTDLGVAIREGMQGETLAMFNGGSWQNACLWDCSGANLPSQEERDKVFGWAAFPGSGQPGAPTTTNISGGWAIGINSKTSNADLAFDLLTTIFNEGNFAKWTIAQHRMGVRTDISESDGYLADAFLAEATKLAATTTGRDTSPGYQIVSALIQQATASILDGDSVDDIVSEYHAALIDEFGEDNVMTYD